MSASSAIALFCFMFFTHVFNQFCLLLMTFLPDHPVSTAISVLDDDAVATGMYDNRAVPGVPVFTIVLLGIATTIVTVRVYNRFWVKSATGWDDVLMLLGLVCPLVICLLSNSTACF